MGQCYPQRNSLTPLRPGSDSHAVGPAAWQGGGYGGGVVLRAARSIRPPGLMVKDRDRGSPQAPLMQRARAGPQLVQGTGARTIDRRSLRPPSQRCVARTAKCIMSQEASKGFRELWGRY
ncbi:hypothetical protein AAFF_G00129860 [Aldrovandia affinis]|uniref:Uncharacterized protein n=1 Tax=Aldrovandia affinis TaxID=143900 RepID=A0AAD7W9S2_9TELE|nr:hypothetical protein AAFF_G00129860 [Aldrovandia affinis]